MSAPGSDYTPGDEPVPVGTTVRYEGGYYTVEAHGNPQDRSGHYPPRPPVPSLEEAYPDGVAYVLWPVTVPRKMDNGHFGRSFVRRTSFTVVSTGGTFQGG